MELNQAGAGIQGVSETLRAFVEQMPWERRSILRFVMEAAAGIPAGSVVLDIGAGPAPYRELFVHCDYRTTDWDQSVHEGARDVDYVAPADALPLEAASVDIALLTQVLEHVPDPAAVLTETARVLRPGGRVALTVPFVWELHELPFDFWRFTPASLRDLLERSGFERIDVAPRNDCFSTIAQMLRNLRWVMGSAPDGRDPDRAAAADVLDECAERLAQLAPLDAAGTFPLGWAGSAYLPMEPRTDAVS